MIIDAVPTDIARDPSPAGRQRLQLYPHEKGDKEHKMRRACEPAHDQVL
jgi:hypothetical protein